jgi:hypothetical protein
MVAALAVAVAAGCDERNTPIVTGGSGVTTGGGGTTSGGGMGSSGTPTGSGGAGGASGSGGGMEGCGGGSTCTPGPLDATYVLLSDTCEQGTPRDNLLNCAGCQCTASSKVTCSAAGSIHGSSNCTGGSNTFTTTDNCFDTSNASSPIYAKATVTTGGCAAAAGGEEKLGACQLDTPSSCGMNMVCLPEGQPVCILVADGETCPPGYDGQGNQYPLSDGGSCNCACDPSGNCPGQVRLYSDEGCNNDETTVNVANDACGQAMDLTNATAVRGPDPGNLTCQPGAMPSMPMALCCPRGVTP